jgi:hypothetical protein
MTTQPTQAIAAAVDELCSRNERTAGAIATAMYLGTKYLLVELRRPVVIEGQYEDVAGPADELDICDLIDAFRNGAP